MHARARRTDPSTSHQAAFDVESTGSAESQRARCLEIVRKNPGLTAPEIAELAHVDRYVASRRLPDLRELGHVRNGPVRRCRIKGTSMLTWESCSTKSTIQGELF